MKKLLVLLLVAAMAVSVLAGCTPKITINSSSDANSSSANSSVVETTVANNDSNQGGFDEDEVVKNIKYTSYSYVNYSYNYLALVVKNNSKFDCKLEAEVTFFNKKGKIVGTESATLSAFQAGSESALRVSTKDKYDKFEVQFSASELTYYTAINSDLKCQVDKATDKAIVSVTNNGKKTALYTKGYVFFFKDGKIVRADYTYVGDSKSEIKPGKTQRAQVSCYDKFDSVKAYVDTCAKTND